jgi:site-specific recombinase XerD
MLPSFALSPTPLSWDITINAFLQLKRLSGFSPSTLEWYEVTFRLLKGFHDEHQLPCPSPSPCTCPPEHLQAFLWWLSRKDRPITAPTKFPALHAFFRWLAKEGLRKTILSQKSRPPKSTNPCPKRSTKTISPKPSTPSLSFVLQD